MNQEFTNTMIPGLNPGDKLGYFEVQSQIATGGMSLVWKGYDKLLNRAVAIKQIASGVGVDETFRERFRKEAQIQKKLGSQHPALIELYDFIDDQRGLFIVMEYVDGLSLDQLLDQLDGAIPPKQALAIISQATAALHVIHQSGIIHRDLKPANILLPKAGGIRVADFGLATLQAEQDALSMGTARYMAPELFGEEPAEGKADIYSLGMMSYEMLAGRPAFEQTFRMVLRDQRHQATRWMKWHTNNKITATRLDEVNSEVSTELADMVHRMISKDPTQRIESAQQLLEVIKRNFDADGAPRRQNLPAMNQPTSVNIAVSDNPTALLPKKSKVIPILVVMMLLMIGVGGFIAYQEYVAKPNEAIAAIENERLKRFGGAIKQYDDAYAKWADHVKAEPDDRLTIRADALAAFDEPVAMIQTLQKEAENAEVFTEFGESYIDRVKAFKKTAEGDDAMVDRDFEKAILAYTAADTHFAAANDRLKPRFEKGTAGIKRDWIVKHRNELKKRSAFASKVNQIRQLIDQQDYNEAFVELRKFSDTFQGVLTSAEEEILLELQQRRLARINSSDIEEVRQTALKQLQDGDAKAARKTLERAVSEARFDVPVLNDLLKTIKEDMKYETALADAVDAKDSGKWRDAIRAYETLINSRPSEAESLRKELPFLRSELAYEEGLSYAKRNMVELAKQKMLESGNSKSKAWLRERAMEESQSEALARAKTLLQRRQYEAAIDAYNQILEKWPSLNVSQPLQIARFRILARKANEQEASGQLSDAIRSWNEARASKPNNDRTDIDTRIIILETKIELRDLFARADAELTESNFASSDRLIRQALKLAEDVQWPEFVTKAKDRLQLISYRNNIAQARAYLTQKKIRASRAAWKNAKAARPEGSKELDDLDTQLKRMEGEE